MFTDRDAAQAALQYGTTPGYPPLRESLLDRDWTADGPYSAAPRPSIEQVVVTAGSNQLLHLVGESLLDPGDIVLCTAPTYLVVLGTFSNLGARTYGVAADEHGMAPEALEEALRRIDAAGELDRVKCVYLTPYFDNPRGVCMPLERRRRVVELAKRWSRPAAKASFADRIYVIADAAYRELRYAGEDIPGTRTVDDEGDTVVVAGTFSKSFSPGIRVGWGILPKQLVEPVCNQKGNFDFGSPNLNQHLMSRVLRTGLFEPHVQQLREHYRVKLKTMLDAADRFLGPLPGVTWGRPAGGLYVWVRLPREIAAGPSGRLFDAAVCKGVLYVPGEYCYASEGEPVERNTMRLSFGVKSCEEIQQGMESLADAIREAMS